MKYKDIIKKSLFYENDGVKTLHINGTPYEMGYQHGYHLGDKISLMINTTLQATIAYMSKQTGWDLNISEQMMWKGMKEAQKYFPDFFKEEMMGIADGVKAGGADVSLEQIMLWNTNYDQWCIYCHPNYWKPDGAPSPKSTGNMSLAGGGCSSFCAWDEWAGGDGKLIFGKNEDNFNMPGQLDNRMLVIANPDDGAGHCFLTYPGLLGLDGGFNEHGFEMMTQLNSMDHETMAGCGIAVFTRLLLTYGKTIDDGIAIFKKYPRCAGIAYHIADAVKKEAVVVETSSKKVCLRYPQPGVKALWQTNHSNCYPGWMGYNGYNMVNDQKTVNELTDISTVEKWQESLRVLSNIYVQAPSRFERYHELILKYKGLITTEVAQNILSDLYDPYTKKERKKWEPSISNNIMCTICALYPDMNFTGRPPAGEFKARIANMWSMVSYPETGDFWLAINDFPAQYGGYKYFNLNQMLALTKIPATE